MYLIQVYLDRVNRALTEISKLFNNIAIFLIYIFFKLSSNVFFAVKILSIVGNNRKKKKT